MYTVNIVKGNTSHWKHKHKYTGIVIKKTTFSFDNLTSVVVLEKHDIIKLVITCEQFRFQNKVQCKPNVITTRDQWDQWGSRGICRKKADTFTEAHYNVNTAKGGLVFPVLKVGWPHYVRHYEKCWVYHTELYTHSSQIWASFTFPTLALPLKLDRRYDTSVPTGLRTRLLSHVYEFKS